MFSFLFSRFIWQIVSHSPLIYTEKNIAKGGVATQCSQYMSNSADKAIDGNHDADWSKGSCSSTLNFLSPWWRLDLLKPHQIHNVTITISNDGNYKSITGAEIHIGNSLDKNGNLNPR